MKNPDRRKEYEKPSVKRVRLQVEHAVLAGCHNNLPNMTGVLDYEECWVFEYCMKTPT